MENTKNICKRSKLNIDRDDGVKLRPEISMQRSDENTHSILLKRNGNSNEVRKSKFSPKRVSFLDDEGQLAILLMPSSGENEKQRYPGMLKTHYADVCKSQEAKKQLIIIVGIIFVILALIIVVVVVIKEIQQVLQSQEPEKMNSYGKQNHALFLGFFFKSLILKGSPGIEFICMDSSIACLF